MEFFNQNKQRQQGTERLVMIFYSLYTINMCISSIHDGNAAWVAGFMATALFIAWVILATKYRNFRIRVTITSILMQFSVILYAAHLDELSRITPIFMLVEVLIAFYGFSDVFCTTLFSLAFVIFYHGVILDSFRYLSQEEFIHLSAQLAYILGAELALFIWVKNRSRVNGQVYEMIEALMEAEQSKDDFLSNVSHEIRTPVNTICGMSEMALREQDIDKMREELFDIRDAGQNLMSLVSDILDFSQLQLGKMNLEEEAYNITSTIHDLINMEMARKGDKDIELIIDCAADIPTELLGDEQKIRRVVMNLVDNAIKFTNEGGIIIKITARKEDYGVNLCISVKDTGIGIGADNQEKLFESFSQVDTGKNRQKGGIGLGLAISKELIQKMGGTMTVRSRLGKGSVFNAVIPQKVMNEKPIADLVDRESLNIGIYMNLEQFDMMTIRDEYASVIIHMIEQLQVKSHVCRNLQELKRRIDKDSFTHIFISLVEYQEDEEYFNELSLSTKVIIVIDRPQEKYVANSSLIRLYKPFYILPVVSILNGNESTKDTKQMIRQGKFIAPSAHILVVDDNRMNIRVVEGLLKEYKIKVSYATSGMEALDLIENMSYDFVFMDHMMPEMDGIETMHRIRDKGGHYYQRVPIIALTANATPGNREMFLDEGFDDFVAKPIEISVLERVLKRNLPLEKIIYQTKEEREVGGQDSAALSNTPEDKKNVAKIETTQEEPEEKTAEEDEFTIGDFDVKQGILYCGGKEEYLEILAACYEEAEEECGFINGLFEKQDWPNYTIRVHGLKSTMKNIGANTLSEKAKALELAGKKNDIDFILANHEDMLAEYHRVIEDIGQSPLVQPLLALPGDETFAGQEETVETENLPELDEETFDKLTMELEDAMYTLEEEQMLAVLSRMQEYQYRQTALAAALEPVKKKIEMSDYMSAVDAVTRIREKIKEEQEGGNAGS